MDLNKEYKTIKLAKSFLYDIGCASNLGKKENYTKRLKLFQDVLDFPWRSDQKQVLDEVIKDKKKYYVVNGIFGCGKTTLLFGIMIHLIMQKFYHPSDILFISFNVCIKNELKRKLKPYGFKGKIKVSTFDSIIYFICKYYKYEYLDLPNFDGKRRFCQKICDKGEAGPVLEQPKIIFIDEVQDLERNTFRIFQNFYPNSKIVFAGDIFQSIQREPRDSLLWHLLHQEDIAIAKYYMNITPRVPKNILGALQKTLSTYYPEFKEGISKWKSTNQYSESKVIWQRIYSYRQIFDLAKQKIMEYGEDKTMILTFSSAITVKGALGDVARLRRNFISEHFEVNKNHKKFDNEKLFLSTANSSKGLERDHVVVFLTFPLEKAFSNFSDDIVVNLITVAITRAKKTVHFFVPAYEDKFTRVLTFFDKCPNPNKEKIREGKRLEDYTFQDYMESERCVTELIRQNIIFYDTRLAIKEFIKKYESESVFSGEIKCRRPVAICEEEQAMIGVIIENLITSTWSYKWPLIDGIEKLRNHPMYIHIFKKIENLYQRYQQYSQKQKMNDVNQFKGIYMYSQLHLAMYNKLFITFSSDNITTLEIYWKALKPKIITSKPKNEKIRIQANMWMPFLTGIADTIFEDKSMINGNEYDEVNVWEIKASVNPNWKDDALTQAFLYALMTGKAWSRITLINPFRNEKANYYFKSNNIMTLRNQVYRDILSWNFNCFLAKNFNRRNPKVLKVDECYFACLTYRYDKCPVCLERKEMVNLEPCHHQLCWSCATKIKDCPLCRHHIKSLDRGQPVQLTIVEFTSPSKAFVKNNDYFHLEEKNSKQEKLCCESYKKYDPGWREKLGRDVWLIGDNFHDLVNEVKDWKEEIKYIKNEDLRYELDFEDGLVQLFCYLHLLSKEYKFI